jgi:hypothetical protein
MENYRQHFGHMKYFKLFLPFTIYFLILIVWEIYFQNQPDPTVVIILKFGLLIFYLRLDNSRTLLINTLTLILILMGFGEYLLLSDSSTLGQIIFSISSIAFGLFYFFRQKLKETKDKLSKLKIAAVSIFVLTNILRVGMDASMVLVGIGALFLASVYFYDRLVTIADSKKVGA